MKIQDLLRKDVMILDLKATSKEAAIDEMITSLVEHGVVTDFDTFKQGIMNREAQTSTGLGDGIAMPHSKNAAVKEATVLFAKSAAGVDYEALDGQPTYLFFMIAAPDGANDTHLAALAELSKYLLKDGFADQLRQVTSADEVIATFNAAEEDNKVKEEAKVAPVSDDKPLIVAVTACTTGIAHTYMAEEALIKQGDEMGVTVRVETNGASGVGNRLTADEIARAKGVIIAADKAVEMARFDGKALVSRPVADGIKKSEELINIILDGKAETYTASAGEASSSSDTSEKLSLGAAFYKHLMSGVSQMLPFVIGGGILIAISFLIDQFIGVPKDQLSHLGNYHEVAAVFNQLGNAAFGFMIPVFAAYIAYSIAEKPGLVAGFTAGAIATSGLAFGRISFYSLESAANLADKQIASGFLGALVGGFLAGGVILVLKKALAFLPKSLEGIKSILLYPLLGVLVTGFLMLFINIPMAAINSALYDFLDSLSGSSAIILGLILGGMMAIDMGGPFNKAAYVFGTSSLTAAALSNGGSVVMAAVMAGGMVPPLAVFVATRLFKDKFTAEERDAGLTNIVMGLSFVFALTSNWILYLVAIVIGAIISGLLFGALRKAK